MRFFAVLAATLLLSGCSWVQHEIGSPPPAAPAAKPDIVKPHKPPPRPAPPAVQAQSASPVEVPAPSPPDYGARCHAMADNRATDAKQLGATAADQARVQSDTYRDCMAQSVK
jgi:hypothetical protein